jgi:hypothetical protein
MPRKRILAGSTLAILAAVVVASSAVAGTIKVAGTQVPVDESTGSYEMNGSLVGKWNITAFKEHYKTPSNYVGSGKERFVGCIDTDGSAACDAGEPTGTMSFTFIYWATFDPATKGLIRGACIHPVTGGTGDFSGLKGIIQMKDVPVGKDVRTTFTGTLTAPSLRTTAGRVLASRGPATCGH